MFAGAGSGKTRVITRRIAWRILEHGAAADSILAVTFTNKAAREMRSRVEALGARVGAELRGPWVSTFHAFGLALLRRFGGDIGLPSGFPVFGVDESRALFRKLAREMQLDEDRAPLGRLVQQVSRLRNAEAAGAAYRGPPDPRRRETIRELARAYRQSLADQKAVDFDGLLIRALELLDASENARSFVARRAQCVLVDEYQDTSPTQHRLLLRLAPHRDVFAVGDDDQSIYSFRGADFRNILRFREDFPGARVFRLEDNYRSTAAILEAANAVIRRNRRRAGKTLRALGGAGERVRLRHHETDLAEAQGVALEIAGQGNGRGSTAVLVRTRAQTRPFEEAFAAHRIPHVIVGGLRFYERREVLDALASLRLALNAADDSAFRRALAAIPRGVGPQSLRRIEERAAVLGTPLLEAAQRIASEGDFRGSVLRGLRSFLEGAAAVERAARQGPQASVLSAIEDTGLGAFLEANDRERFENLVSLRAAALEFERVNPGEPAPVFLDQVSLLSAEDLVPDEAGEAGAPPVLVMTVHAAKGLEFDQVFLGGLWDGLFPHALSLDSESGLEEERRLLHVGMTRAKKRLLLSAAPGGAPFARTGSGPSRFLDEIRQCLDTGTAARAIPARPRSFAAAFRKGQTVRHPKFGIGRVESVDPDGKRLSVLFRYHGRRRLVLEYARLERINP